MNPGVGLIISIGLIVLVVYYCVRSFSKFIAWISGSRYRPYRQLAARYDGRYESRGQNDSPTVSFTHNGSTIRVGLAPIVLGQPQQLPLTRVVARFAQGIPFRFELMPTARRTAHQAPKGTQRLEVGDPEFDRWFVIRANDHEMARDFLSADAREVIRAIARGVQAGGMVVQISPERMLVQIDRDLGVSADALAWAVRNTLLLHDRLLEGVSRRISEGIAIVDLPSDRTPDEDGPPICKVCGEAINGGGGVTKCRTCRTPYHGDCWVYVGRCSIYGCDGKLGEPG
jgi:hypothetical protein